MHLLYLRYCTNYHTVLYLSAGDKHVVMRVDAETHSKVSQHEGPPYSRKMRAPLSSATAVITMLTACSPPVAGKPRAIS